jgi:hypothetical protein
LKALGSKAKLFIFLMIFSQITQEKNKMKDIEDDTVGTVPESDLNSACLMTIKTLED